MAVHIIDADVPLKVEGIIAVFYGIPGIGKTSLAFTADNPLLEDYDGGLQRAVKRKQAIRVDSWEDAVEFHNSGQLEEMKVKTLIIDTVGTMLDNYVAAAVIRGDAKNGKRDGSLGLSGYGAMKNVFNQFVNQMKMKKIDIIFIAHDTTVEEGGYNKKTLKITGGSYDIIKSSSDLIGYINMENSKRVLDFNPTDNYHGKNSGEFPKMIIPDYNHADYDGFLARIIQKCKDKMNALSEDMVESQKKVEEFGTFINDCETIEELEMMKENIDSGLSKSYIVQIQKVYDDRFIALFYKKIDAVKKMEDLTAIIELAGKQDKKHTNQMKSSINKCLDAKKWTWDKTALKVIKAKVDDKPADDKGVQTKIEADA